MLPDSGLTKVLQNKVFLKIRLFYPNTDYFLAYCHRHDLQENGFISLDECLVML